MINHNYKYPTKVRMGFDKRYGCIMPMFDESIIDDNTFKSTYQILKELSLVWNELSDISRANILEMVGGKRNSNIVSALLENFSVAEEALETSVSSAGSAIAENEKYSAEETTEYYNYPTTYGDIDKFLSEFKIRP